MADFIRVFSRRVYDVDCPLMLSAPRSNGNAKAELCTSPPRWPDPFLKYKGFRRRLTGCPSPSPYSELGPSFFDRHGR